MAAFTRFRKRCKIPDVIADKGSSIRMQVGYKHPSESVAVYDNAIAVIDLNNDVTLSHMEIFICPDGNAYSGELVAEAVFRHFTRRNEHFCSIFAKKGHV